MSKPQQAGCHLFMCLVNNTRPFAKSAVVDSRELSRWPKFTISDGAEYRSPSFESTE